MDADSQLTCEHFPPPIWCRPVAIKKNSVEYK